MDKYPIIKDDMIFRRVSIKGNVKLQAELMSILENKILKLNPASEEVVSRCNGINSIKNITEELSYKYNNEKSEIFQKVKNILKFLEDKGFINILDKKSDKVRKINEKVNLSYPLSNLFIETTKKCNLRCLHCYASANIDENENELEYDFICDLIDQFSEMGGISLALSGGEPLVRNDIFEIIDYAVKKPLSVSLLSNGILIDKTIAKKLKELKIFNVQISLDGHTPEIHDKYRNKKGAFDITTKAIDLLIDEGIKVTIGTVLNKLNIDYAFELSKFCEKRWNIAPTFCHQLPQGRALNEGKDLEVSIFDFSKKNIELFELNTKCKFSEPCTVFEYENNVSKSFRCGAGLTSMSVTVKGEAKPCIDMKQSLGDLKKNKIIDIWNSNHPLLKKIREMSLDKINICNKCKHLSYCRAGCMMESDRLWGDINWPDIQKCMYYEMLGNRHKIEIENVDRKVKSKTCKF